MSLVEHNNSQYVLITLINNYKLVVITTQESVNLLHEYESGLTPGLKIISFTFNKVLLI